MSKLLEAEGAHPVWSYGCGRFSQSDLFLYFGRREDVIPVNGSR